MAPTTTVRITQSTADDLDELADATGLTKQAVVAAAVRLYSRDLLLRETNAAFARLREDPSAWREELAERAAWEATLEDDLEAD